MSNISVSSLLKQKKDAKRNLSKELSFSFKKPLLGIFLDNELCNNIENKLKTFLNGVKALDIQVVILADSNLEALTMPNIVILPYNRISRKTLLEASDMALIFPFSDIEEMLLHGTVPISISRPEVSDYDPNHETGNSFIYSQEDPWHIFAALVRARETFKFPYDWKNIIRQGVSSVCKG